MLWWTEMLTQTYASVGFQAVFGTLNEEGLKEMLAKKNLAGLLLFIGRLMEELGVRHPEEKCVREVAERAYATGAVPKAYKWILNYLHP